MRLVAAGEGGRADIQRWIVRVGVDVCLVFVASSFSSGTSSGSGIRSARNGNRSRVNGSRAGGGDESAIARVESLPVGGARIRVPEHQQLQWVTRSRPITRPERTHEGIERSLLRGNRHRVLRRRSARRCDSRAEHRTSQYRAQDRRPDRRGRSHRLLLQSKRVAELYDEIKRTAKKKSPVRAEAPTGQSLPHEWAIEELNLGPHAYQACALTT